MICSIGWTTLGSVRIAMIFLAFAADYVPIANQFFLLLVGYLKPSYVILAALARWDGVLVPIKIAMFFAFVVGLPGIVCEFGEFIGPALKPSEKRIIVRMPVSVVILFFFGALLDYFVSLPFTINSLYAAQRNMGIQLFQLPIDGFVSFDTIHLVAFGIIFQLPVVICALAAVGGLKATFWKKW